MKASTRSSNEKLESLCLVLALVISLASMVGWLILITHAYKIFLDGGIDLTYYSYNLYLNLHYPNIASGIQFLVISNHIAPDMLLLMPIYYLHQSSLTLLYVQTIVICLTSFLIFLVARKLIKDPILALVLSVAFLFNSGVMGILTFDFHVEFLLIPAYILTFYFYMVSNKKLFAVSLILLLGTLEIAPVLALTMGLGLLAYEMASSSGKPIDKDKKFMLMILLVSAILSGIIYYSAIQYLSASYATSYQQLPKFLRFGYGSIASISVDLHSLTSNPAAILNRDIGELSNPLVLWTLILSILIVFIGFGLLTLKKPLITFLLSLQWFVPVLLWYDNISFINPAFLYYSYTIGSTVAATLIGAMFLMREPVKKESTLIKRRIGIYISIILIALFLSFLSLFFATAPEIFVASYNVPTLATSANQLQTIIELVPSNASLMTTSLISSHLAERKYLEFTSGSFTPYFVPDYVLLDYGNNTDVYTNNTYTFFQYVTKNYTYELYAQDGNAKLYKRS